MIRTTQLTVACAAVLAILGALTEDAARGAVIGPDAFGYTATNDIPFSFHDISGTGTRVLAGVDDSIVVAPVGFSFSFYGVSYVSAGVSSNGVISFGGVTSDYTNDDLSTTSNGLGMIAVLWDDWQFFQSGADAVYYETVGAPGSLRFITQWEVAYGYSSSPSSVTFQAILFEGSNDILFQYLDVDSGDGRSFGASSTVGISDVDGSLNGNYLQWSLNSADISNSEAILFSTNNSAVPEPFSVAIWSSIGGVGFVVGAIRRRRQK